MVLSYTYAIVMPSATVFQRGFPGSNGAAAGKAQIHGRVFSPETQLKVLQSAILERDRTARPQGIINMPTRTGRN
jgi:hypothetical protein